VADQALPRRAAGLRQTRVNASNHARFGVRQRAQGAAGFARCAMAARGEAI